MRLHTWDGKKLDEIGVLEGNQGLISALAFSPDGKYLVAGDVSVLLFLKVALHCMD